MLDIRHNFTSPVADDPEAAAAGEVLPSHWNEAHEIVLSPVSLVGNDGASSSPARAISVGSGLRLSTGVLAAVGIPVFFSAEQPADSGPYLWIQPVAGGLTAWVNDGLG